MTYLKPWRRKLGIVLLLLACTFVGAWVRSGLVCDDVIVRRSPLGHESLQSGHGQLLWGAFVAIRVGRTHDGMQVVRPQWSSKQVTPGDALFFGIFESMPEGWHLCGVGNFVKSRNYPLLGQVAVKVWAVPYWMLAIPLITLSAWLLLSKPRPGTHSGERIAFL